MAYAEIRQPERPSCGSPWAEGREGARQEAVAEAPQRDSSKRGDEALGFVYFIETTDQQFVKIGFSTDVRARLQALETGCPFALRLRGCIPGGFQTEQWLHGKFAAERVEGEWFRLSSALAAFIDHVGLIDPPVTFIRKRQPTYRRSHNSRGTLINASENGRIGGRARALLLSAERRKEIAALGGKAKAAKKARRKRD